ncbi:hypothetical protein HELRODRAFT_162595 [Helobdella robusta]|uniref:Uncharacterized protein n=1 Tax=Helobdella robusta TaxID=6412 RepID=T1ESW3_HELRO|nr:hypothetical protein HELRODRAFT_162595 [Helobdella robusta]ESN99104.1 hypothetical protein HELRODRAFT_162595 [Helobdella robusta]
MQLVDRKLLSQVFLPKPNNISYFDNSKNKVETKNYWKKMMYPISLKNKCETFENNNENLPEVAELSTEDNEDDDEQNNDSSGSTNLAAYKVYRVSNETPGGCGVDADDNGANGDNYQSDDDQESYDDYIISSVHFLLDHYIKSCGSRSSASSKGKLSSGTRDIIDKLELFLHIDK